MLRSWRTVRSKVSVVGDLDIEAAIAAVAQTLGALPAREARPAFAGLKKVSFPAQPFNKSYTIASRDPQGQRDGLLADTRTVSM